MFVKRHRQSYKGSKLLLRRINSSGDIVTSVNILAFWLETAYSRPFLGSLWGIFSPYEYDVTHRPDPWSKIVIFLYPRCIRRPR